VVRSPWPEDAAAPFAMAYLWTAQCRLWARVTASDPETDSAAVAPERAFFSLPLIPFALSRVEGLFITLRP
jgi:S1-C subfamily serine protease